MLDDVIGEYCDDGDWPQIFMAGIITVSIEKKGCIKIFFITFIIKTKFMKLIHAHSFCPREVVTPNLPSLDRTGLMVLSLGWRQAAL